MSEHFNVMNRLCGQLSTRLEISSNSDEELRETSMIVPSLESSASPTSAPHSIVPDVRVT